MSRKMSKSNRTSQSDKLDEIREQLILLNENFREARTFFMEFLQNWRQERSSTRDTILESLGRITSQVDELNSQMIDIPDATLLNDTNAIWIKKEAFRIRRSMNKMWQNNLNQRKQAFWNMLKNENTSVIYVNWFSRDKPIIPKKFQSKTFPSEPEEQKKIKEELSLQKMKAQAQLHHVIAERNKAKYEDKDKEMLTEMGKISSEHIRHQLQELWKNDCKKQEEKSQKIWELKKTWFEEFESNVDHTTNSDHTAPTTSNNRDQRRRRRKKQRPKRPLNNTPRQRNNQSGDKDKFYSTNNRNSDKRNNNNYKQPRYMGQQRNRNQNNRQQHNRFQRRNTNRNAGNNRGTNNYGTNSNQINGGNRGRSGRSNYNSRNRRPFLGRGRNRYQNQA